MIQKKICLLGAFAVGKTSMVSRFVRSIFSEKYHTTVGVKIDKKEMTLGDTPITLMLWDLHGEDEFQKVRMSYLRGASGYLLVVDGTRKDTLDRALMLHQAVQQTLGEIPYILVVNKSDLSDDWEIEEAVLDDLTARQWEIVKSSAKTGEGVEYAFQSLTEKMMRE